MCVDILCVCCIFCICLPVYFVCVCIVRPNIDQRKLPCGAVVNGSRFSCKGGEESGVMEIEWATVSVNLIQENSKCEKSCLLSYSLFCLH